MESRYRYQTPLQARMPHGIQCAQYFDSKEPPTLRRGSSPKLHPSICDADRATRRLRTRHIRRRRCPRSRRPSRRPSIRKESARHHRALERKLLRRGFPRAPDHVTRLCRRERHESAFLKGGRVLIGFAHGGSLTGRRRTIQFKEAFEAIAFRNSDDSSACGHMSYRCTSCAVDAASVAATSSEPGAGESDISFPLAIKVNY